MLIYVWIVLQKLFKVQEENCQNTKYKTTWLEKLSFSLRGGERIISRIFIAVPQLEIIFHVHKHTHTHIVNAICLVAGGWSF